MQIGSYILKNNLIVASMAGVTDRPFRQLCKQLGADPAMMAEAAKHNLDKRAMLAVRLLA